ncbi:hypothetical protein C8R47DRAFT_1081418 [Mycena vitilis]|nr:hypothetical protein C8R47DRAFT_1081418 [Mycena vitilis]
MRTRTIFFVLVACSSTGLAAAHPSHLEYRDGMDPITLSLSLYPSPTETAAIVSQDYDQYVRACGPSLAIVIQQRLAAYNKLPNVTAPVTDIADPYFSGWLNAQIPDTDSESDYGFAYSRCQDYQQHLNNFDSTFPTSVAVVALQQSQTASVGGQSGSTATATSTSPSSTKGAAYRHAPEMLLFIGWCWVDATPYNSDDLAIPLSAALPYVLEKTLLCNLKSVPMFNAYGFNMGFPMQWSGMVYLETVDLFRFRGIATTVNVGCVEYLPIKCGLTRSAHLIPNAHSYRAPHRPLSTNKIRRYECRLEWVLCPDLSGRQGICSLADALIIQRTSARSALPHSCQGLSLVPHVESDRPSCANLALLVCRQAGDVAALAPDSYTSFFLVFLDPQAARAATSSTWTPDARLGRATKTSPITLGPAIPLGHKSAWSTYPWFESYAACFCSSFATQL